MKKPKNIDTNLLCFWDLGKVSFSFSLAVICCKITSLKGFDLLLTFVDCSPPLALTACGAFRSLHIPFSPIGYEGSLIYNYYTVVLLSCRGLGSYSSLSGPRQLLTLLLLPRSCYRIKQHTFWRECSHTVYGWYMVLDCLGNSHLLPFSRLNVWNLICHI